MSIRKDARKRMFTVSQGPLSSCHSYTRVHFLHWWRSSLWLSWMICRLHSSIAAVNWSLWSPVWGSFRSLPLASQSHSSVRMVDASQMCSVFSLNPNCQPDSRRCSVFLPESDISYTLAQFIAGNLQWDQSLGSGAPFPWQQTWKEPTIREASYSPTSLPASWPQIDALWLVKNLVNHCRRSKLACEHCSCGDTMYYTLKKPLNS